jgi:hypothetical protein
MANSWIYHSFQLVKYSIFLVKEKSVWNVSYLEVCILWRSWCGHSWHYKCTNSRANLNSCRCIDT